MKIIIISQKVRGRSAWTLPFSKEGNTCKTYISESVHFDHCARSIKWFWMQTAAVPDSLCVNLCQGTRVPWFLWTHLHTHLPVLQLWNQFILTCMCPVGLKDCIRILIKAPCVLTKLPWWKHLHCLYSVIKEPSILSMLFQSCPAFLIWASMLNSTLLNTVVRQTSWLFICVWNENSNVPNAFTSLKMGLFFLRGR